MALRLPAVDPISNRDEADRPEYDDVDLALLPGADGRLVFIRKDGRPYADPPA
jgi:hypothetical protein